MSIQEITTLAALICLVLFATIGMIDGFYLHLWKFKLYAHDESRFEHQVHTVRAVLFPFILYFLFVNNFGGWLLWLGVVFVLADMLTLAVDALNEGDSRTFMGGLPKWEYVIHLFANGFHFASIALVLASKPLAAWSLESTLLVSPPYAVGLQWLAQNLLPGALLLAVLHIGLAIHSVSRKWLKLQTTVHCC
jgi:hypothetical protein